MKHAVWGFIGLGGFVGISLVAVTAAAFLGGAFLRSRALTVSKSSRWMLFSAVMCQFAFVLLAIKRKAPFLCRISSTNVSASEELRGYG